MSGDSFQLSDKHKRNCEMSVAAATHTENISDSVGKKFCSLWVSDLGEHLQEKKHF